MCLTTEAALLNRKPGLRRVVLSSAQFAGWRDHMATVIVDDETFWVVGGDQLKDLDQIIVTWLNIFRPDLLPEDP